MDITRDMVKKMLKNLNAAENSRPHRTVEETIAAIDSVCAPDFKVSHNNDHFHDREKERELEKWLFTMIPDYNRTIELTIIDPPHAAFEWIMRGTVDNKPVEIHGCSVLECSEDGLLKQGTGYGDTSQFPSPHPR